MLDLIVIPSPAALLTAIEPYSQALFTELLPLAYIMIGCVVAGLIIKFLMVVFEDALASFFEHGDTRGYESPSRASKIWADWKLKK